MLKAQVGHDNLYSLDIFVRIFCGFQVNSVILSDKYIFTLNYLVTLDETK